MSDAKRQGFGREGGERAAGSILSEHPSHPEDLPGCFTVYIENAARVFAPYLSHLLHQISRRSSITAASSRRKDVQMPRCRSATFASTPSSTKYLLPHPPTAHSKRSHLLCRAHGPHRQAGHSSTPPRCNASLTPPLIARSPITAPFTPRARISGVTARRCMTTK